MSHPFLDDLGAGDNADNNPFIQDLQNQAINARQQTAVGRANVDAENISRNIARLQAIRDNPKTSADRKKHLDLLIQNMQKPAIDENSKRGTFDKVINATAAGTANAMLGAEDLAMTLPDLAGSDFAHRQRAKYQEHMATIDETLGVGHSAPEVVGGLVGGLAGAGGAYGGASEIQGAILSPVVRKFFPKLAASLAERMASNSTAQRVAARSLVNVLSGLPLQTVQALSLHDTGSPDDFKQRLKTFGLGVAGDVIFGAAHGLGKPGAGERTRANLLKTAAGMETAPAEGVTPPSPDRIAALETQLETNKKNAVTREAQKQLNALAKAQWQVDNPNVKWESLKSEDRKQILADYGERVKAKIQSQQPAANPNLDQGEEPPPGATPAPLPPKPPTTGPASEIDQKLASLQERVARGESVSPEDQARLDAQDKAFLDEGKIANWWDNLNVLQRATVVNQFNLPHELDAHVGKPYAQIDSPELLDVIKRGAEKFGVVEPTNKPGEESPPGAAPTSPSSEPFAQHKLANDLLDQGKTGPQVINELRKQFGYTLSEAKDILDQTQAGRADVEARRAAAGLPSSDKAYYSDEQVKHMSQDQIKQITADWLAQIGKINRDLPPGSPVPPEVKNLSNKIQDLIDRGRKFGVYPGPITDNINELPPLPGSPADLRAGTNLNRGKLYHESSNPSAYNSASEWFDNLTFDQRSDLFHKYADNPFWSDHTIDSYFKLPTDLKEIVDGRWSELTKQKPSDDLPYIVSPEEIDKLKNENPPFEPPKSWEVRDTGPASEDAGHWWNSLDEETRKQILGDGFQSFSDARFDELDSTLQDEIRQIYNDSNTHDPYRTNPEHRAILEDTAHWWDSLSREQKQDIIYHESINISRSAPELPFSDLSHADQMSLYYARNKPQELDLGKTVYEPSAAERAAKGQIPPDLHDDFVNQLIDGLSNNKPGEEVWSQLQRWAAANEVTDEQLAGGLQDMLGETPEQFIHRPSPGNPTQDLPPISQPTLPPAAEGGQSNEIGNLDQAGLDALKEDAFAKLEQNPEDQQALDQLKQVINEEDKRNGVVATHKTEDLPGEDLSVPLLKGKPKPVDEAVAANKANLLQKSPRRMTDEELSTAIQHVGDLLTNEQDPAVIEQLNAKLKAFAWERTQRLPPPPEAHLPPSVFGAAVGFTYGLVSGGDDDQDRLSRAAMWAAVGALGASASVRGANWLSEYRAKPNAAREFFPEQNELPKVVYSMDEIQPKTPSLMARFRMFYIGTVRSSAGLERITSKVAPGLPTAVNPGKLASIFGRWVAVSERWMTHGPVMMGPDGEPVKLDGLPLTQIVAMVQGDIKGLGELMVARSSLELQASGKPTPMDQVRAEKTYRSAPEEYHQAADEIRKLNLAEADVLANSGVLNPDARDKFAVENWFAHLFRVFGEDANVEQLNKIKQDLVTSQNPVKARKGSTLKVINPVEATIMMIPRVLRAAELNKVKQSYIDMVRALPEDSRAPLLRRVSRLEDTNAALTQARVDALSALMPKGNQNEIKQLVAAFGEKLDPKAPRMTVYENGELVTYAIHPEVFQAFKGMMPQEFSMFTRLAGLPTRAAAQGTVLNPYFMGSQSFIDAFQVALQSRYGFRPGFDSAVGWWNIVSHSERYQKLLDVGGPATLQSLQYTQPKQAISAVRTAGSNALDVAVKQIREFQPLEAAKTLMLPIAEAARVGEALRAMDHGASTIEAVYAAWHAAGNTRMQGSFAAMRAFNFLTLFSRPAISALDEAVTKAGIHPFREPEPTYGLAGKIFSNNRLANGVEFMTKGFAYLTIPTMIIWSLNKDDEDIRQLRQTESGRRYWFFRTPDGEIGKIRKPHVLGQLFGSTVEDVLDQMAGKDPAVGSWVDGLANDAAFNVLPQIGVVPGALWANRQIGLGQPVVPNEDLGLEPELAGYDQASNPARIVAHGLNPLVRNMDPQSVLGSLLRRGASPAGVDFLANNVIGLWGQDGMRIVAGGINYANHGWTPASDEWPVIGRMFAKYPSMNTRDVRQFYNDLPKVDQAAKSFTDLAARDPQVALQYLQTNLQDIRLAPIYDQTRQEISNLRRAIVDMEKLAEKDQISQAQLRQIRDEFLRRIMSQASIANNIARQMRTPQPTSATP